ncbi:MAG: MFS transporter [Tepidisphaera sp.]
MSAKWRRSLAWDDEHFPKWAWPAKVLVRAFSSIGLAVSLLVCVALYGVLASVPIGLIALAPTYAVYALTVLAMVAVIAALPSWAIARKVPGRGAAFVTGVVLFCGLGVLSVWLWWTLVWPPLHYDPARGTGLRFFAEFCDDYKSSTLRRLPGVEMSELEFYGWWPLRVILLAFVMNMVIATARRIEFNFKNLGVLTVHTGIITIALGSVYYHANKLEGDLLLLAGAPDPATGTPTMGPPQGGFHDNTRVALHLSFGGAFEQRLIPGLPRYNSYNLSAVSGKTANDLARPNAPWLDPAVNGRTLDIPLAAPVNPALDRSLRRRLEAAGFSAAEVQGMVDRGVTAAEFVALGSKASSLPEEVIRELVRRTLGRSVSVRVVGYAPYAELTPDYVKADISEVAAGEAPRPVWFIRPMRSGEALPSSEALTLIVLPGQPATRINSDGGLSMEYTLGRFGGMTEDRFRDLSERLPQGTRHALVAEIPGMNGSDGKPVRVVTPVEVGTKFAVGGTGYVVAVTALEPKPEFPIITPGYEGATSSLVKVTITTPAGESYDRWVYHRFPEISQDFLPGMGENGMPKRRAADPAIRIGYIDASQPMSLYADSPAPDVIRAVIRREGGDLTVLPPSPIKTPIPVVGDQLGLVLTERWDHSTAIERPMPVPEMEQDRSRVGTHDEAAMAVEVTWREGGSDKAMSRVIWLPFTKYMDNSRPTERAMTLPDGRKLILAFGRMHHTLPGFTLRLKDFEMISYDHRGSPRDYQSTIEVDSSNGSFEDYEHIASLNYPLTAPFLWNETRGLLGNLAGTFTSGLNPGQFKFSQAGWDAGGWQETQRQTDAGRLKRPFAKFTILQVGNNPGIHLIALGGILMGLGIPWAFYVKPWLVQREKRRIQAMVAAGTYVKPVVKESVP